MSSITIIWRTMMDDRVCPVCRAIEGYTWVFETGSGGLNGMLTHPTYGVVWTTELGSQAHGHRGHCRCHLDHNIDISDVLEKLKGIESSLHFKLGELKI